MSSPSMKIGKFEISENSDCFVIAEVGHNHQGDLGMARKMVLAAAECGAHAVKLQKRSNRDLFTRAMYDKPYENENSFGETYGRHREFVEFGEKEYKELKMLCEEKGMVFFATPFDIPSVEFLDKIGVPAYKIASACITDIPLIEHCAKKGKPMIISTGTATIEDVDRAYQAVKKYGTPLCLMQCTAAYPLLDSTQLNLKVIETYKKRYSDAVIGYSGHDNGIVMPVIAYMLGARMIEKHFTLNRALKGTDQKFSLEPAGMKKMVRDLTRVKEALGNGVKTVMPSEADAKVKLGKSIYARKPIKKGELISPEHVTFKSPGGAIPPYLVYEVLGRRAEKDISEDQQLKMEELSSTQEKKYENLNWADYYGK